LFKNDFCIIAIMEKLIFATNNKNKVAEIRSVLGNEFEIISLREAEIFIDIPEPHDTLEENAREKSSFIYALKNQNCFSEDTGLEVDFLQGAPGVKSARYAGDDASDQENKNKLLKELEESTNRDAQFKTIISLQLNGKEYQFTGVCKGIITTQERGVNGFGYDTIFIPEGSNKTFAEMELEEKNKYSHRKKATQLLIHFLNQKNG